MPNAVGRALTIGLNAVGTAYSGYPQLTTPEQDARDIAAIGRSRGFVTKTLLANRATRAAVVAEITAAAAALRKGDMYLLSFSGHGRQVPDRNREETDIRDEAWVLYNGLLLDDDLFKLWGKFKAGVRVLVFSDSCNSGTILTADFGEPARARRTQRKAKGKKVKASVLLISACQDNENAYEYAGQTNSAFIAELLQVWDNGRFRGDYKAFHAGIRSNLSRSQTPNLYTIGAGTADFKRQTPFTI